MTTTRPMTTSRYLAALILLGAGSLMAQDIAYERFTLDNGLTVILHPDATLPLAAVDVWYHVGSKDEPQGRSGFAHLFEHLMFMGTERVPEGGFDEIMEKGGGSNNASTSPDRTNYYSSGPASLLPTLLWLEADRMDALGRSMDHDKLDLQRKVVRNERRQSYENRPYGSAWLELPALIFPEQHPYRIPVIGTHEDLEAAQVTDVVDFFNAWYAPNNASLVVAGAFDPARIRPLIEDLFGGIERRPTGERRPAPAFTLPGVVRRTIVDERVPVPRVMMAWTSPTAWTAGDAAMDLVGEILAGSASSRLEKALVQDLEIAQDVSAFQNSGLLGSTFMVIATALPGVPLTRIESTIDSEIRRMVRDGVGQEELERHVTGTEVGHVKRMQDLVQRADMLNAYLEAFDDPAAADRDLDRYRTQTPESIRSTAARVLDPGRRAILRIVPKDWQDADQDPRPRATLATPPPPLEALPWEPPVPSTFKLSNGIEVWLVERHSVPLVQALMAIPGGALADPEGRAGRASLLADILEEGAGDLDAAQFSAAEETLGATISSSATRETIQIGVSALRRNLEPTLDLVRDMLLEPRLAEEEARRVQALALAAIAQRAASPAAVSVLVAGRHVYAPDSPYGRPPRGTRDTVSGLGLDDLRAAYEILRQGIPGARMVVAGDVTQAELRPLLETRFGSLKGQPLPIESESPAFAAGLGAYLVDRPGAPQTVLRFVLPGPVLAAPETPACWLANVLFGGSFTSRLNQNLREDKGYTYGAGSSFTQGRVTGTFTATSNVRTEVTGEALREFLAEFARNGAGDASAGELAKALATERTDLVKEFETVGGATAALAGFAFTGLPPGALRADYEALTTVDVAAVNAAARLWMVPRQGVIVLVGDRQQILPQLENLSLPPLQFVDEDGNPVAP